MAIPALLIASIFKSHDPGIFPSAAIVLLGTCSDLVSFEKPWCRDMLGDTYVQHAVKLCDNRYSSLHEGIPP